jgi:hypothetical protein
MNHQKYFLFLPLLLIGSLSVAMQPDEKRDEDMQQAATTAPTSRVESVKEIGSDARKRDIFFKTVAVIKVGLNNKYAQSIIDFCKEQGSTNYLWPHPLCEGAGMPYKDGDGGLLNPIIRRYETVKESVTGPDYTGVQIAVSGCVSADGVAAYKFDNTHIGNHYEKYVLGTWDPYEGKLLKKDHYKMSKLEEAILGFLKERMIDRQISDLCKRPFTTVAKMSFADRFAQCIKHEWTSKQNGQDSGLRTDLESDLIQRHMARSTYWPSRWHSPKDMRSGEEMRREHLHGNDDPYASVELSEFEVEVKIPGVKDEDICLVM